MCQPVRQKGTSTSFLNLGGNRVGKANWEERKHDVGFEVGPCRGAGCTAEGHCYICPFPLEIVTSSAGLHVGWPPQMSGFCSTVLLGC